MAGSEIGSIDEESVEDIKVVLRMRPLNKREKDPTLIRKSLIGERAWKIIPEHESVIQMQRNQKVVAKDDRRRGRSLFTYDKVFGEDSETGQIYDVVAKELVESSIDGRNGSIFAYGQTGSGKTHTIQGSGGSIRGGDNSARARKDQKGILQMVAEDLFRLIEDNEERDYVLQVSVLEVYNEEVRDLLSKKEDKRLSIREDPASGVFVNAIRREASSLNKLLSLLSGGERNRVVARTTLNKKSSRSHIIFSINIESFPAEEIGSGSGSNNRTRRSNLNIIDLAGSESVRHRSAHSTEKRRKEGGSINKSLLTLSLVIQALGAPRKTQIRGGHINYRDSKLTRVLQPSLSGNARLAFICCATASGLYMEETKSTFQFASRIKHIKTSSRINVMEEESSSKIFDELKEVKRNMSMMEKVMRTMESDNRNLRRLLDIMTIERDDALERSSNLEKAKNAAVLAAAEADVAARTRTQRRASEAQSSKPPLSNKATASAARGDQGGFLSNVVGKIRGAPKVEATDTSAYQKRQETPLELLEEYEKKEKINGMPANIRADSARNSIQSELTNATRYGGGGRVAREDEPPEILPLLGLVESYSA